MPLLEIYISFESSVIHLRNKPVRVLTSVTTTPCRMAVDARFHPIGPHRGRGHRSPRTVATGALAQRTSAPANTNRRSRWRGSPAKKGYPNNAKANRPRCRTGSIGMFRGGGFRHRRRNSTGKQPRCSPPSGEHCESGSVCVWKRTDYEGERTEFRCTFGVHSFGGEAQYSAKNRCPERRSILTERAEAHYVCMNPGTNEERPGKFYEVVIGNVGEDC